VQGGLGFGDVEIWKFGNLKMREFENEGI